MKKVLILLLFSSCAVYKKPKVCHMKTTKVDNVNFIYDPTVWKVLPMTKTDSIWADSIINLNTKNK
jgi:hypothetical protein